MKNEPFKFSAKNEAFKFSAKNEAFKFSAKNEPFKFSAKNEPFKFSAKNEPFKFSAKMNHSNPSRRSIYLTQYHVIVDFPQRYNPHSRLDGEVWSRSFVAFG